MEVDKLKWLDDYQRIERNPVFFIEKYYNKVHPKNKICLTDDEKQYFFNRYRSNFVPMLNDKNLGEYDEYRKKIDEQKKQGLKDWEIF
jgi:ATP-dependent exoDNAse (exonuclease V) alpha subunit